MKQKGKFFKKEKVEKKRKEFKHYKKTKTKEKQKNREKKEKKESAETTKMDHLRMCTLSWRILENRPQMCGFLGEGAKCLFWM